MFELTNWMFELTNWMFALNDCEVRLQDRMLELKVWIKQQKVWILAGMDTHSTVRHFSTCHSFWTLDFSTLHARRTSDELCMFITHSLHYLWKPTIFSMARNLGHARADDTADETKNMSHNILNYRDFTMKTETITVYQLCLLRLLIHRSQTFRPCESHFPGLRSRCGFRTCF